MALNPNLIEQHKAEVVAFPIVPCGCNRKSCKPINLNEHSWVHSAETKQYYSDLECMTYAEGADYDPSSGRIVIDDYEYTKSEYMEERGASWNG